MRISLRAITAALLPLAAALPAIHRKGKFLYDDAGARFYIKVGARRGRSPSRATSTADDRE